jgi:predicted transcriptional regulator
VLDVSEFTNKVDLSSVVKLPNLRELKVYRLTPFKSASLQKLTFSAVSSKEILTRTDVNCPNIGVVETGYNYIDIDLIFLLFPKLESLNCYAIKNSGNTFHHHLKHLRLNSDSTDKLLSIVNRCEVLESLSTCDSFDQTSLKNLLLSKPGLKSLYLKSFSTNLVATIKEFGGNLRVFQCTTSRNEFDLQTMKNQLKGVFDKFKEQRGIYIAKKAGAVVNFKFDWEALESKYCGNNRRQNIASQFLYRSSIQNQHSMSNSQNFPINSNFHQFCCFHSTFACFDGPFSCIS